MSNKGVHNRRLRRQNVPLIEEFCKELGLNIKYIAGDWHIRIDNKLDVYPTRQRWFWLPTKERGGYKDFEQLQDIDSLELEVVRKDVGGKTPSQRLRAVLFVAYQQSGRIDITFEQYYAQKVEAFIDRVKSSLDN